MANLREKFNQLKDKSLSSGLVWFEKVPPLSKIFPQIYKLKWPVLVIAGFLAADLSMQALSVYVFKPQSNTRSMQARTINDPPYIKAKPAYEPIIGANVFCRGCPVPDLKTLAVNRPKDCGKARAIANSTVKIIGTIVLSDPQFSVVTLSDGGPESTALKKGDAYKDFGKVFEIRRTRICFETAEGTLKYIEMPEDVIKFGQPLPSAMPPSNVDGISRLSDNEVEIKRPFLVEKLNDPNTLFQAQAVPYKDASGSVKGFQILSIVPGSVYETIGLKANDVITGVNGEPMNSIARAQELYAAASTADEVTIEIMRNGQTVTQKFKVK